MKLITLICFIVLISNSAVCQTPKRVKIGTSPLNITLPYEISSSTVDLPKTAKDKLAKYEFYEFTNENKKISGKISYMIWKPEFDTSLENAIKGALNNIKSLQGIENLIESPLEYFRNHETEGCIYRATVHRYGKVFYVAGAVVKSDLKFWNIPINYLQKEDTEIVDNILNSLK